MDTLFGPPSKKTLTQNLRRLCSQALSHMTGVFTPPDVRSRNSSTMGKHMAIVSFVLVGGLTHVQTEMVFSQKWTQEQRNIILLLFRHQDPSCSRQSL